MTSREAFEFYNAEPLTQCGRPELQEELGTVTRWLQSLPEELRTLPVLELGCGLGAMRGVSPRHVGIDLSLRAIASGQPFRSAVADMESLPVASASIGAVFSWAAIEHVPHPESVLAEITRTLATGGIAILKPAWHCRPWAAEGLEFRPYADLTIPQRIRKALIPMRNSIAWRVPGEAVRRARRELRLRSGRPIRYEYGRLTPNLESYVGTDCDAFTSLDPHATIAWFVSRGWKCLSHPRAADRLRSTHEEVVVQKP